MFNDEIKKQNDLVKSNIAGQIGSIDMIDEEIKKGKGLPEGTKRTHGGKEVIKRGGKWVPTGKSSSSNKKGDSKGKTEQSSLSEEDKTIAKMLVSNTGVDPDSIDNATSQKEKDKIADAIEQKKNKREYQSKSTQKDIDRIVSKLRGSSGEKSKSGSKNTDYSNTSTDDIITDIREIGNSYGEDVDPEIENLANKLGLDYDSQNKNFETGEDPDFEKVVNKLEEKLKNGDKEARKYAEQFKDEAEG